MLHDTKLMPWHFAHHPSWLQCSSNHHSSFQTTPCSVLRDLTAYMMVSFKYLCFLLPWNIDNVIMFPLIISTTHNNPSMMPTYNSTIFPALEFHWGRFQIPPPLNHSHMPSKQLPLWMSLYKESVTLGLWCLYTFWLIYWVILFLHEIKKFLLV